MKIKEIFVLKKKVDSLEIIIRAYDNSEVADVELDRLNAAAELNRKHYYFILETILLHIADND